MKRELQKPLSTSIRKYEACGVAQVYLCLRQRPMSLLLLLSSPSIPALPAAAAGSFAQRQGRVRSGAARDGVPGETWRGTSDSRSDAHLMCVTTQKHTQDQPKNKYDHKSDVITLRINKLLVMI